MESVKTQVKTIAEEELKTGKKIIPEVSEEQFVQQLSIRHTLLLNQLETTLKQMKAKHIKQALIGAFDTPKEGIPVNWVIKKGANAEIRPEFAQTVEAWRIMQELNSINFAIINYQVRQNKLKYEEQLKEMEKNSDKTNTQQEEGE